MRITLPIAVLLLAAANLPAQLQPPPPENPPHDISQVDVAPLGGAIAIPLPEHDRKRLKKYDIPELAGCRQAVGSQRIDGRLPKPLVDYSVTSATVFQRLSIFEGGLVVIESRGAGGTIRKKVILPPDALQTYLHAISPSGLATVRDHELTPPRDKRQSLLRAYDANKNFVERQFDPLGAMPKTLSDQVISIQDLLRALFQDRGVTNSVAGYMPKVGDELVGDDSRIYKVVRLANEKIVELRCLSQPTTIYVDVKDLYNYFIGTPGAASR